MENLAKANQYFERGRLQEAKELYQRLIQENPTLALAYQGLGQCLLEESLPDEAYAASMRALDLAPQLTEPLVTLAGVYLKRRQFNQAREVLDSALIQNPDLASAYIILAHLNVAEGHLEAAIKALESAIKLKPRFWKSHYNMGVAFEWQNLPSQALREFWLAFRLRPSGVTGLAVLGANIRVNRIWYSLGVGTAVLMALILHSASAWPLVIVSALFFLLLSTIWLVRRNYKSFLGDLFFGIFLLVGYFIYLNYLPPLF